MRLSARSAVVFVLVSPMLWLVGCSSTSPSLPRPLAQEEPQAILARVRRQAPAKTPAWVNAIPDRLADILITRHRCPDGEVWGLAKSTPDQELAYDEMGSATFLSLVKQCDLFDQVGPLDETARLKVIRFWQSWQDAETGRFKDPRDPSRQVNEKYIVGLLGQLGAEPLYPWTTTGQAKKIETAAFLSRSKEDPDWADGGWSVGSHTGYMAVEIWRAINDGQTELIPDLERGMEQILSHQGPDGLWGPPGARVAGRIGGTLKVVGRFYFTMGMPVSRTKELADALIANQRNGVWYANGHITCVPRNVAEVVAYCLEVSDYRRDDLLGVLEALAEEYREWVNEDGSTLVHRGQRDSVGLQYTTLYGLGIIGAYLHWEDCRLPNPLAGSSRGAGSRYRPVLLPAGRVKVVDTTPPAGR